MTPQSLLKVLKATAEQKGYFLHADEEHCLATAESLLENKQRYGYLCCPCFCTLFVDAEHRDDPDFFPDVDERRPPENMD